MIDPKLKSDVSEVIRYSQNIENPMIDKLLEDWLKAKSPLMKKFFNGGVSYRSEEKITFELNDESKSERYDCFIEYVGNLIGWNDKIIRYLQSLDTEEFYQAQSDSVCNDSFNWGVTLKSAMDKTDDKAAFVVSAGDQIQTTKKH